MHGDSRQSLASSDRLQLNEAFPLTGDDNHFELRSIGQHESGYETATSQGYSEPDKGQITSDGEHSYESLHRSFYIVVIALLYSGASIFAWIVTCKLVARPMTLFHYDVWKGNHQMAAGLTYDVNSDWGFRFRPLWDQNDRWYRAARVVQSVVDVLTIPVASAVCGSAAVVYMQTGRGSRQASLGQTILLADKGWADPATIFNFLFGWLFSPRRTVHLSTLMLLALAVHLIGGIISPLRQILLTTTTVTVPTGSVPAAEITDLPDQVTEPYHFGGQAVLLTRAGLETARYTQVQNQLWQANYTTCETTDMDRTGSCIAGATLGSMYTLSDPFLAELPVNFSTGVLRQFSPRINSTDTYETITADEYPGDCHSIFGAFWADYENITKSDNTTLALHACMPNNNTLSPWAFTRDRQDFTEELYLNITVLGLSDSTRGQINELSFAKVTVKTTAGYFELPNHMNGGATGPLLATDPFASNATCGHDCLDGHVQATYPAGTERPDAPTIDYICSPTNSSCTYDPYFLETVSNKGPLLTVAMALFGHGSFIQTRLSNPEAYAGMVYKTGTGVSALAGWSEYACSVMLPMGSLILDEPMSSYASINYYGEDTCVLWREGGGGNGTDVHTEVGRWLTLFTNSTSAWRLTNAFTAASFVANQNWLMNEAQTHTLTIYRDTGSGVQAPVISTAGIIGISVLLGLFLLTLLALSVYAAWTPRWTRSLDAFAMIRIGAAYHEHFPLKVTSNAGDIPQLRQLSGKIGTKPVQGEDNAKSLQMGGGASVRSGRYTSYDMGIMEQSFEK